MENRTQRQLYEGVKSAVAKYGVSGASTRLIAQEAGVNDAIIYYYFKDRNALLTRTYEIESGGFMQCIVGKIREVRRDNPSLSFELSTHLVIRAAWRYLLEHPDMCRFCSYYYHSPAFHENCMEHHKSELDLMLWEISHAFPSRTATEHCLYAVFNQLYDFAIMVLDGRFPDSDETEQQLFGMLYSIISGQKAETKAMKNSEE